MYTYVSCQVFGHIWPHIQMNSTATPIPKGKDLVVTLFEIFSLVLVFHNVGNLNGPRQDNLTPIFIANIEITEEPVDGLWDVKKLDPQKSQPIVVVVNRVMVIRIDGGNGFR